MSKRYSATEGSHYTGKKRKTNGTYVVKRQYAARLPPETKYFDTAVDSHSIATAASWAGTEVPCDTKINGDGSTVDAYTASALIPSAVGTGYGEIIGTRYNLKRIRIKGILKPNVAQDQSDVKGMNTVRLVLVQDTNANGAQAQGETVFTDFGSDNANVNSFLNMGTTAGKFRILKDMRVVFQPGVAGTDGANTNSVASTGSLFSMSWAPRKPIMVTLAASAATPAVAQLQSTNIFLLCLTDASDATISCVSRCYYCE